MVVYGLLWCICRTAGVKCVQAQNGAEDCEHLGLGW